MDFGEETSKQDRQNKLTPEPAQVTQCIEEMKLGERYLKSEENLLKLVTG